MRFVWIFAALLPVFGQTGLDCRKLDRLGKRTEARGCFQKLTNSPNPALRAEGFWGLGGVDQANEEFKAAAAAQPKNADVRVRWGRFFLERWQPVDAKALFAEALAIRTDYPPALLGVALAAAENFDHTAVELAEKALKLDPKLIEAQELLARIALEDSNPKKAVQEADKAIKLSPDALDAMAVRASVELLENKTGEEWFGRIAQVNPKYGQAYATAAHFFVLNRRYEEGIAMYKKALDLDPDLHGARSQLGINLMRLGRDEEARKHLEAAYAARFKSPGVVNTLTLLDSYKNFTTLKTENTIVKLHKKEAELLGPYIEGELKRAIATYEKKYKVKLDAPVQVEVYPDHEDFAVRTLGMPGLGALGVAFGNVVAMDSPSGRAPGQFHWASTLWHELSHVYVLTATKHRVPRWFTEGMAVHEETAASPEWGDRLDFEVIKAIKEKKLLPVAELDRGFVRPSYPSQVIVSYFQAGRICDFINEKWSYAKLLEMMHAFAESKPTPEVIESKLGVKPEEFDKQFLAWLDGKHGKTVASFDDWRKKMKLLAAASKMGGSPDLVIQMGSAMSELFPNTDVSKLNNNDVVIKLAGEMIQLYPDYVETNSPYELLAKAYEDKGDKAAAAAQLERYASAGGKNPATLTKLATLQSDLGQKKEAIRALERLMYVYPMGEESHRKLGDLYLEAGNHTGAIREFTSVVAAKPVDEAGARFNLARALHSAKRMEEAKEQLLLALEAAPSYRPAQKLLLEMSR